MTSTPPHTHTLTKARKEARKAEEIRQREAELLEARKAYFEERKTAEVKAKQIFHGSTSVTGGWILDLYLDLGIDHMNSFQPEICEFRCKVIYWYVNRYRVGFEGQRLIVTPCCLSIHKHNLNI